MLSSCLRHRESSPGSYDECSTTPGGCRPLDAADQLETSSPIGCQLTTLTIAVIITQTES